ncbi:TetR/AcrR family transcriptional regulator [Clostridium sp. Mt-5]|uniref:TetR/AcrR family transcriptional regulator n=1 Tax=Clostridium moutaii TaxID=3240932 RepID=A0ABV4BSI4_9CLOT
MTIDKIKLEAMKLFAVHGYEKTSMQLIANNVGIKKASLYAHFKGKEDIFFSIVNDCIKNNKEELKILSKQLKSMKTIEQKLYAVFCHISLYPTEKNKDIEFNFFKRNMFFPPEELKDVLHQKLNSYEEELYSLILGIINKGLSYGELKTDNNAEDLLKAFMCTADGVMLQIHYYSVKEFFNIGKSVWKVFWNGIGASDRREHKK